MTVLIPFTLLMAFLYLACHVIVLIFLYRDFGAISAVFGVCCFLYAYIWGWQVWKDDRFRLPVMITWTAVIVIYLVGSNIIRFLIQ